MPMSQSHLDELFRILYHPDRASMSASDTIDEYLRMISAIDCNHEYIEKVGLYGPVVICKKCKDIQRNNHDTIL